MGAVHGAESVLWHHLPWRAFWPSSLLLLWIEKQLGTECTINMKSNYFRWWIESITSQCDGYGICGAKLFPFDVVNCHLQSCNKSYANQRFEAGYRYYAYSPENHSKDVFFYVTRHASAIVVLERRDKESAYLSFVRAIATLLGKEASRMQISAPWARQKITLCLLCHGAITRMPTRNGSIGQHAQNCPRFMYTWKILFSTLQRQP